MTSGIMKKRKIIITAIMIDKWRCYDETITPKTKNDVSGKDTYGTN